MGRPMACRDCAQRGLLREHGLHHAADAVLVWPFRAAPAGYRELSTVGGDDAEWLAFVPDGLDVPDWIVFGTQFDRRSRAELHSVPGGAVWIGSHA